MIKEQLQEQLNLFANDLLNVIENYQDSLQPYEMIYRMIAQAVKMSLACAPNHLVGIKTIMVSVQDGIDEFEDEQSQGEE